MSLDPPTPAIRYERDRLGELLHLDTKKFGRIGQIGHRIHGDRRRRSRGVGWEFLYVCVDYATRLAYAGVLPDERGTTAASYVRRAVRWFAAQGVATERVMTYNGSCYVSNVFAAALKNIGARHVRTRPYTPRTNGEAERFIRTVKEGWAYARPCRDSNERTAQLSPFLTYYNCGRPHGGIKGMTPLQRLTEFQVKNVLGGHN